MTVFKDGTVVTSIRVIKALMDEIEALNCTVDSLMADLEDQEISDEDVLIHVSDQEAIDAIITPEDDETGFADEMYEFNEDEDECDCENCEYRDECEAQGEPEEEEVEEDPLDKALNLTLELLKNFKK